MTIPDHMQGHINDFTRHTGLSFETIRTATGDGIYIQKIRLARHLLARGYRYNEINPVLNIQSHEYKLEEGFPMRTTNYEALA